MRFAKLSFLLCLLLALGGCRRKPRAIHSGAFFHAISPDGKSVVFDLDRSEVHGDVLSLQMILLNLRTGATKRFWRSRRWDVFGKVVKGAGCFADFAWSPDGKAIYAITLGLSAHGEEVTGLSPGVYRFFVPSGVRERIVPLSRADVRRPRVSPDGKWLLFHDDGAKDLFRCKANGEDFTRFTYFGDVSSPDHHWTRDGNGIYFVRFDPKSDFSSLWRIDADGSNETLLLEYHRVSSRGVSPSGRYLALYLYTRESPRGLYIFRPGDGEPEFVAERPRYGLTWHCLEETLFYVLRDGLYEWRASTRTSRKIASGDFWFPEASPDGKTILFTEINTNPSPLWKLDVASGKTEQVYPPP